MTRRMRCVAIANAAVAVLFAACSASAPAPATSPTSMVTVAPSAPPATSTPALPVASETPAPTAPTGVRPSLPWDAPAISEPYWLVDGGISTSTWKDEDDVVTRTVTGRTYQVIRDGAIEDGILLNGTEVALLTISSVTGDDPIPGLNAIEEQFGSQIDDKTPDPSLPFATRSPGNPDIWTRSTQVRGGVTVYVRTGDLDGTPVADAHWWGASHDEFRSLTLQADGRESFDALLTAVLGPTE